MPTLIRNPQNDIDEKQTTFFENKTWFLADEFFSASLLADLNDIPGAAYSSSMHCPAIVTKKEVIEAMKTLNSNKTIKLNIIINRFLKTCENDLINVLPSFFQICVNWKYHFKTYQKKTWWLCVNLRKTIMTLWKHNVQLVC